MEEKRRSLNDPDVQDIRELLEVVSKTVPDLLTKMFRVLYSEEAGREMGKAVGTLYKELIQSGIPQDVALKMTSDYMLSLKDITQVVNQQGKTHKYWDSER